jgi:hypothetical protein
MGDRIFHRGFGCRGFWFSGNRDGSRGYRENFILLIPGAFPVVSRRRPNASSVSVFPIQIDSLRSSFQI